MTRVACICTHRGDATHVECAACCGTRELEVTLPEPGTKLERKESPGRAPTGYVVTPAVLAVAPWLTAQAEALRAANVTVTVHGDVLERYLAACGFDLGQPEAEIFDFATRKRREVN